MRFYALVLSCTLLVVSTIGAQTRDTVPSISSAEKIIIDTDIGSDIDDAFAVALAVKSPELEILGVSAATGDTHSRAKLLDRLLGELGRSEVPVAEGISSKGGLSQQLYADGGHFAKESHPVAIDFILDQIRRYPNQITLVAIGPLVNVAGVIDRDPETFRKLKRVVIMGGSVYLGYDDLGYAAPHGPDAEYNIASDIPAARKLFQSGVPLFMMPLDSTQLKLDEVKRAFLFRQGIPVTDALATLYYEWGSQTPTLYDAMTIAYIVDPSLCPVVPMRIEIDDRGFTRPKEGAPNANVCLRSDSEAFFRFYLRRLLAK